MPDRSTLPAVLPPASPPADLAARAADFTAAAMADNTRRAYAADWRDFEAWARSAGVPALPADEAAVVLYLTDLAGKAKSATVTRRVVAIRHAHSAAGIQDPTDGSRVRALMRGIRRTLGGDRRKKRALSTADVRAMVAGCDDGPTGARDRAVILLGFAGAFRRSEIAALTPADIAETAEGVVVTVRRSKTDQEGEGRVVGIPWGGDPQTCPVRALRAWAAGRPAAEPTLFGVNDRTIAEIVKRRAGEAGIGGDIGGHSLRAGHITQAAANGADEASTMAQAGHASVTVHREYRRFGTVFVRNSASTLGL